MRDTCLTLVGTFVARLRDTVLNTRILIFSHEKELFLILAYEKFG